MNTLKHADKERTFDKLFELPPELRDHIYGFHIRDLEQKQPADGAYVKTFARPRAELTGPAQPPLADVSRRCRSEVLPVFYNTTSFDLSVRCAKYEPLGYWDDFIDVSYERLSRVRKVNMHFSGFSSLQQGLGGFTMRLELLEAELSAKITSVRGIQSALVALGEAGFLARFTETVVQETVQMVSEKMEARAKYELELHDIDALIAIAKNAGESLVGVLLLHANWFALQRSNAYEDAVGGYHGAGWYGQI
jgi:hypothetical protein